MDWCGPEFEASTILPGHSTDDVIRLLALNLKKAQENGVYAPEDREVIDCSLFLVNNLRDGFGRRYAEIVRRVEVNWFTSTSEEECCIELRKMAQRAQPPLSIDVETVPDVWKDLLELDDCCIARRNVLWSSRAIEEDCALASRLASTIDWLLGAIKLLSTCSCTRTGLARAGLTPALRLDAHYLSEIFKLVAQYEAPRANSKIPLGWMRLSHVCGVWRRVLLDMSALWARDAYVFGAEIATKDILPRVRSGSVSVTTRRDIIDENGKTSLFCKGSVLFQHRAEFEALEWLAHQGHLRDLNLNSDSFGLSYIRRILGDRVQPHLRMVSVRTQWQPKEDEFKVSMAPHPNLRHVELVDVLIPFALPRLVSLHVLSKVKGKPMPRDCFDALLDSLEASPTIEDLRILYWVLPSPSDARRRVALSHLNTLCSDDDSILAHLHLPSLQRAVTVGRGSTASVQAALQAIFEHYALRPSSMQLSQRKRQKSDFGSLTGEYDVLTVRLGWTPNICPPAETLPLSLDIKTFAQKELGPFISLSFLVGKRLTNYTASGLLGWACHLVGQMRAGSNSIRTVGFDNEMRCRDVSDYHFGEDDTTPQLVPLTLPHFPSVRSIELPMRHNELESAYHILSALTSKGNSGHLPLLRCIKFMVPLPTTQKFKGLHDVLARLLRARTHGSGLRRVRTLEFELLEDGGESASEHAVQRLKSAAHRAIQEGLPAGTVSQFKEADAVDARGKRVGRRLVVTIAYGSQ